jgi:hypothetical protein
MNALERKKKAQYKELAHLVDCIETVQKCFAQINNIKLAPTKIVFESWYYGVEINCSYYQGWEDLEGMDEMGARLYAIYRDNHKMITGRRNICNINIDVQMDVFDKDYSPELGPSILPSGDMMTTIDDIWIIKALYSLIPHNRQADLKVDYDVTKHELIATYDFTRRKGFPWVKTRATRATLKKSKDGIIKSEDEMNREMRKEA